MNKILQRVMGSIGVVAPVSTLGSVRASEEDWKSFKSAMAIKAQNKPKENF